MREQKQKYNGFFDANNVVLEKGDKVTVSDTGALADQLGDTSCRRGVVTSLKDEPVTNQPTQTNYFVGIKLDNGVTNATFNPYELTKERK